MPNNVFGLRMRLFCAALFVLATGSAALAQREPEIVIPGRPDVPVIINGVDASWGIVEGEFGLDRPDMATPTIVYRPYLIGIPSRVPGYFPADGRRPGYGRLEVVPPRHHALPPPAASYSRDWRIESEPLPVTEYPSFQPVVIAPEISGRGRRRRPHSDGGSRTHR